MDKETSQNMQDKFMYALQVFLLAFVAALVFSWEAAMEPKIVILLLSAVLIVQLPVVGRLGRMVDNHFMDLTKSHGVTHILLMEMRKALKTDEVVAAQSKGAEYYVAQTLSAQLDQIVEAHGTSLDKELEKAEVWRLNSIVNTIGASIYVAILLAISLALGWLAAQLM